MSILFVLCASVWLLDAAIYLTARTVLPVLSAQAAAIDVLKDRVNDNRKAVLLDSRASDLAPNVKRMLDACDLNSVPKSKRPMPLSLVNAVQRVLEEAAADLSDLEGGPSFGLSMALTPNPEGSFCASEGQDKFELAACARAQGHLKSFYERAGGIGGEQTELAVLVLGCLEQRGLRFPP